MDYLSLIRQYTRPDGQLALRIDEPTYDYAGFAVSNANGVLFLAQAILLLKLLGHDIEPLRDSTFNTLTSLRTPDGMFHRWSHVHSPTSHDNLVGIAILSSLYEFNFARLIIEYGSTHGWRFGDQCQGGDIAFVTLMARARPTPWDEVWMYGGATHGAFFAEDHSVRCIAWTRLAALAYAGQLTAKGFMLLANPLKAFREYYASDMKHPTMLMIEEMYG